MSAEKGDSLGSVLDPGEENGFRRQPAAAGAGQARVGAASPAGCPPASSGTGGGAAAGPEALGPAKASRLA